jgi:hypothetical protein
MEARIIPATLLAIDSFRESLRALLALTPEQLDRFAAAGQTENGFEPTDQLIRALHQALGISEKDIGSALTICSFLYDGLRDARNAEGLVRELGEIATELGITDVPSKEDALNRLFRRNEAYDRRTMRRRTAEAALPVLESVWLYCDLRAVPSEPQAEAPRYVPVITARLKFDETIAGQDGIFFQMTEEALDRLASDVQRTRELIEKIKLDLREKLY